MIRWAASLCALAALGVFEYYLAGLLILSRAPWGLATLAGGILALALLFLRTPRTYGALLLFSVTVSGLPVFGTSAQISTANWTGESYEDGKWVKMTAPSLTESTLEAFTLFAILFASSFVAFALWKRVAFPLANEKAAS